MTDERDNIPDWIRKRNQDAADAKAKEEAAEKTRQEAAMSVQAGGPDFWKRFVDRMIANARSLEKLDGEELIGHVSHSVAPAGSGVEENCYIQVNRQTGRFGPELSQMNLWYVPGGNRIRCWYQNQEMADITLGVNRNGVRASLAGNIRSAEQLADHIVQWMAERVNVRRSA